MSEITFSVMSLRNQHLTLRDTLPPLLIYLAAGLSGMTNIVGAFFVKEHLGLSAEFLTALGFWISLPWTLKLFFAHLTDLAWRLKAWFVVAGATLIFTSGAILFGLFTQRAAMTVWMSAEAWYVWSALLAPVGYVLQDVVADAMTVEAVPRTDAQGAPLSEDEIKLMHTTMQALSRGVLIAGGLVVALINLVLFSDNELGGSNTSARQLIAGLALLIPIFSVLGIATAVLLPRSSQRHEQPTDWPGADPLVLSAAGAFIVVSLAFGVGHVPHAELWVFLLSLAIVLMLIRRLFTQLDPEAQRTLLGTAVVLFVFRAVPDPGPGPNWWMIDQLNVDERFFALLSILGSVQALVGLIAFRRWMAQRSVTFTVIILTLASTVLSIPMTGMYFGLHEWTAALTGGWLDGRAIIVTDTASLSLLSEIAMVPMLAWVARTAPEHIKATYFAVMVSFINLGFLLARLGTQYLNQIFVVTREVRDAKGVATPADYSQLGALVATSTTLMMVLPLATILLLGRTRLRSS